MTAILFAIALLCLFILGCSVTLCFLIYNRLSQLIIMNNLYKADDLSKSVATPKRVRIPMPVVKQEKVGRSIKNSEHLVDLAEVPWEEAMDAIEKAGQ